MGHCSVFIKGPNISLSDKTFNELNQIWFLTRQGYSKIMGYCSIFVSFLFLIVIYTAVITALKGWTNINRYAQENNTERLIGGKFAVM